MFDGSISDLQQRLAGAALCGRPRPRGVALPGASAAAVRCSSKAKPASGKTALAAAIAGALDTDLIRLQCYEGLDVSHAVYEWDYARQLLELRILEASGRRVDRTTRSARAVQRCVPHQTAAAAGHRPGPTRPAVLLIDEIDRADEEFEGYLLELLAEFQITIPELGTVRASEPPLVILTSNRTREVHDALKRRCLYQWIDYPTLREGTGDRPRREPEASARLAGRSRRSCRSCARVELLQGARRVRDARLGRRARRTRTATRSMLDGARAHARRGAQGQGRHRRGSRRAAWRAADRARSRALARVIDVELLRLTSSPSAASCDRSASTSTSGACSTSSRLSRTWTSASRRRVPRAAGRCWFIVANDLAVFDRAFDAFWRARDRRPRVGAASETRRQSAGVERRPRRAATRGARARSTTTTSPTA